MSEIIGIDIDRAFENWKIVKKTDKAFKGSINKTKFLDELGMSYTTYCNYRDRKGRYEQFNVLAKISEVSGLPEEELKIKAQ